MSVGKVIVSFHIRLVMNTLIECVVSLCFVAKLANDIFHLMNIITLTDP